jgi:hypothetical protein
VHIYRNTFTGDKDPKTHIAVDIKVSCEAYIFGNRIGGWQAGMSSTSLSHLLALYNAPTTLAADNTVGICAEVGSGAYIDYARELGSKNTLVWTSKELVKGVSGGFFVQDIGTSPIYSASFVDGDLSSGVLTVTHNLDEQFVDVQVVNNNNKLVQPDDITYTNDTSLSIDLSSFGTLTGTWNLKIRK